MGAGTAKEIPRRERKGVRGAPIKNKRLTYLLLLIIVIYARVAGCVEEEDDGLCPKSQLQLLLALECATLCPWSVVCANLSA